MKHISLSTATAVVAMLSGGLWTGFSLWPPLFEVSLDDSDTRLIVFDGIGTLLLLLLPGLLALFFGCRLMRAKNAAALKGCAGVLAFPGALALLSVPEWTAAGFINQRLDTPLFMLLATLTAVVFYVWLAALLMRSEGLKINGIRDFIGRGITLLVSFEVWLLTTVSIDVYVKAVRNPLLPRNTGIEAASLVAPVLLAWILYRTCVRFLERPLRA